MSNKAGTWGCASEHTVCTCLAELACTTGFGCAAVPEHSAVPESTDRPCPHGAWGYGCS